MTVHIVGSGIASLAAGVYLMGDAKVEPNDMVSSSSR
jgi:myosin-crossreactive antigen